MIKLLQQLKRKEWLFMGISIIFIVVQVWLDLKLPDYMAKITMLLQKEDTAVRELFAPGGYMLLCAIGSMLAAIIVGYFAAQVAAGVGRRLRGKVFEQTMDFSLEEMNRFSTASLITRSTNDITQIQMLIAMGLMVLIKAPILAIWAITKISNKSIEWTGATAVAVIVLIVLISIIILFAIPKFRIIQTLTDNVNRITRENLTGIRVVKAYNAESYQLAKFEQANDELTNTNLYANRLMALMAPSMGLIMSGLSMSIYWIGAYLIQAANGQQRLVVFSDMVVFTSYAMQVVMAFMMVSMMFIMLPRALVATKRVLQVIETPLSIQDGLMEVGTETKGRIEFKDVSFSYPESKDVVIHRISFIVNSGETVAFIGATGSGKTTIVNLIPRFFDATSGEVLIDGVNVKDYKLHSLRNKIGYVSQTATLFSGTVSSNIAFGQQPFQPEKIKHAVAIAQGTEFVEKMDAQYDASIAQSGKNVSGGQKQRLSIARAIYKQPEIFIFDDSFSALDYKTDSNLRKALKEQTNGATTVIVGQRIGTIKHANQIFVLEDGEIVGVGNHEELLRTCKTYQEIAYSQLSKEELDNGSK